MRRACLWFDAPIVCPRQSVHPSDIFAGEGRRRWTTTPESRLPLRYVKTSLFLSGFFLSDLKKSSQVFFPVCETYAAYESQSDSSTGQVGFSPRSQHTPFFQADDIPP